MTRLSRQDARLIAEELHLLLRKELPQVMAAPPAIPNDDCFMTVKEVAELLKCSVRSVYNHKDEFPHKKMDGGRRLLFLRSAVMKRLMQ